MPRFFAIPLVALVLVSPGCARRAAEDASDDTPAVTTRAPERKQLPVAPMPHRPGERIIATTVERVDEPDEKDLTTADLGLNPKIEAALPEIERLDKKSVEGVVTPDPVGLPIEDPPGVQPKLDPGGAEPLFAAFAGRSGATKSKLLKEGGGNEASEKAVALGLAWLAKQQQKDGSWAFDTGEHKDETAAATGLALLPFLAGGETHKNQQGKKYQKVVAAGLGFLKKQCPTTGPNAGRMSTNMYAQGIAAMALCEAYGMTKDPTLKPYAQAAINYIQRAQGKNGSWGYTSGANGDTSITGWQIQALQAAKLSKDIVVDDRVIKKAIAFLDLAAAGAKKSMYGYADNAGAGPSTALTAVGLLSRYYIDGWGPTHAGMAEGVGGLMKRPPVGKGMVKDLYYYYYATQVVHFSGGDDWKTWNEGPKAADGTRKGGLRDWLVSQQVTKDGDNQGSWEPETGYFGTSCGRLGTTTIALLNLEVYYRHLPLHKPDGAKGDKPK